MRELWVRPVLAILTSATKDYDGSMINNISSFLNGKTAWVIEFVIYEIL